MLVTATGSYSLFLSFWLSLSSPFVPLFPPAVEIFISGDGDSPIARALPLFSRQSYATYAIVVELSCFYLISTMPPCSFPFCSSHISSSYFSILFSPLLVSPTAMSTRTRVIGWFAYRLPPSSSFPVPFFRLALLSFYLLSPTYLTPFSLSSSTILLPSCIFFLFLVFPSRSYIYTQRGRMF